MYKFLPSQAEEANAIHYQLTDLELRLKLFKEGMTDSGLGREIALTYTDLQTALARFVYYVSSRMPTVEEADEDDEDLYDETGRYAYLTGTITMAVEMSAEDDEYCKFRLILGKSGFLFNVWPTSDKPEDLALGEINEFVDESGVTIVEVYFPITMQDTLLAAREKMLQKDKFMEIFSETVGEYMRGERD